MGEEMNKQSFVTEIDVFINVFTKKGMTVTGCTEEQIIALEQQYGVLPCSYKIF
jgi:hypothetical protein